MMGLEEHLLTMFRGDFEFHDGAAASHLGRSGGVQAPSAQPSPQPSPTSGRGGDTSGEPIAAPLPLPLAGEGRGEGVAAGQALWAAEANKELQKIPFFVRGKARRNTERYAAEHGLATITVDTLYDAKAHFGR
jgi:light-independent protochlorophyllide reductase subunit B